MESVATRQSQKQFLDQIYSIPDGKLIKQCLQCGTCSASCPVSGRMDYSPREIIAALRAGLLERVMQSNTVWMCSSCYSCTVRCPAGIKITEMMYQLKRLGEKEGFTVRKATTAMMVRSFIETVNRNGRNSESELLARYYLRTNPFRAMDQMALGLRMLLKGRLPLLPHRIKDRKNLRKMIAAVSEGA